MQQATCNHNQTCLRTTNVELLAKAHDCHMTASSMHLRMPVSITCMLLCKMSGNDIAKVDMLLGHLPAKVVCSMAHSAPEHDMAASNVYREQICLHSLRLYSA